MPVADMQVTISTRREQPAVGWRRRTVQNASAVGICEGRGTVPVITDLLKHVSLCAWSLQAVGSKPIAPISSIALTLTRFGDAAGPAPEMPKSWGSRDFGRFSRYEHVSFWQSFELLSV